MLKTFVVSVHREPPSQHSPAVNNDVMLQRKRPGSRRTRPC